MFIKNGAAIISQKIENAVNSGDYLVEISGDYEIETTIFIPSGMTVILSNCHLRMADETFCQMFKNASCDKKDKKMSDCDRNIHLKGIGRAILDGGKYNGLSERNSLKGTNPHISVNNILLFSNVEGFSIEGLQIKNQRWWALNFLYCRQGLIRDIDFASDCTRIDKDGNKQFGLLRENYEQTYIKNADGIDLRCGCHDILIENITGFTEDDTVALTAIKADLERMYEVSDSDDSIHNVVVKNIRAAAYCSIVRLLNQGGTKLYNILVDGVFDTSADSPCMDNSVANTVRFGDTHLYGSRHATEDETFNIIIQNIFSRNENAALEVAGKTKDCRFENIFLFGNAKTRICDNRE